MIPAPIRSKMQKLKALAERGVGGEARAAQAQYDRLKGLHGDPDAPLFTPPRVEFYDTAGFYQAPHPFDCTLLMQIACAVRGVRSMELRTHGGHTYSLMATPEQHNQINLAYLQHRQRFALWMHAEATQYFRLHGLLVPEAQT